MFFFVLFPNEIVALFCSFISIYSYNPHLALIHKGSALIVTLQFAWNSQGLEFALQ